MLRAILEGFLCEIGVLAKKNPLSFTKKLRGNPKTMYDKEKPTFLKNPQCISRHIEGTLILRVR